ncbi:MAG TPA: hypothetical protein VFR86_30430 [Burkholderiaceae bacterium]|nr:hypothetical protein [Burkholderiaceae bacterium]
MKPSLVLPLALALAAISACRAAPAGYELTATPNSAPATLLNITQSRDGKPASNGMLHVLFMPADLSALYHEHPRKIDEGKFVLDLPRVPAGEYDVWIELTVSSGHDDAVLRRFTMPLAGDQPLNVDRDAQRVTFTPMKQDFPRGKPARLEFQILLDGKPVEKFGSFVGVSVHTFAVSRDRVFFVHDHAELAGQGIVSAHFKFPKPGDYVVFLQPTVLTREGKKVTTVLQHAVTVP